MSWSIGYDQHWKRDIGYGVPCLCDHPGCDKQIDRGLAYVCGGEPYGADDGCGLYFCDEHGGGFQCDQCANDLPPFTPKPDIEEWTNFKMTDPSWAEWRAEQKQK